MFFIIFIWKKLFIKEKYIRTYKHVYTEIEGRRKTQKLNWLHSMRPEMKTNNLCV